MKQLIPEFPAIAISGSAGKTTTKEMLSSILETRWQIVKSQKNRNIHCHTKKYAQMIKPFHQAVVLEFGMRGSVTGKLHCRFIQPNISIITNVGSSHFGTFGNSINLTAKKKSTLIKYMNPEGVLVVNNDDKNSKLLQTTEFKGKVVTVGINNKADYQAINIQYVKQGMTFQVKLAEKLEDFFIPSFGEHNVMNALFAIAVAHYLRFTPSEMRLGLNNYEIPEGRLNLFELPNDLLIIDDSYNASPETAKAAINVLEELGKDKRKVVVLGSMLELGEYSTKGHLEVGTYLFQKKVDMIITYGNEAMDIGNGAYKAGFPAESIFMFNNRSQMNMYLLKTIEPNTAILIKGSGGMKMNKTANYLIKQFS
ncbi:MAG: UDP-N-acetylmuramoyl-tripeptide--D-alanyl-D-alanine ligase [Bacillota bacterium]|nr:UDP-N-acetylmuramoyl-tripeptide--D-alanyl-D-alanine ligase [Bacillota bacterium]